MSGKKYRDAFPSMGGTADVSISAVLKGLREGNDFNQFTGDVRLSDGSTIYVNLSNGKQEGDDIHPTRPPQEKR